MKEISKEAKRINSNHIKFAWDGIVHLISFDSLVAQFDTSNRKMYITGQDAKLSKTTRRHVGDFMRETLSSDRSIAELLELGVVAKSSKF